MDVRSRLGSFGGRAVRGVPSSKRFFSSREILRGGGERRASGQQPALELGGLARASPCASYPFVRPRPAARLGGRQHVSRHRERLLRSELPLAALQTRSGAIASPCAWRVAGLCGATRSDGGLAPNQRRLVGLAQRGSRADRILVWPSLSSAAQAGRLDAIDWRRRPEPGRAVDRLRCVVGQIIVLLSFQCPARAIASCGHALPQIAVGETSTWCEIADFCRTLPRHILAAP